MTTTEQSLYVIKNVKFSWPYMDGWNFVTQVQLKVTAILNARVGIKLSCSMELSFIKTFCYSKNIYKLLIDIKYIFIHE